MQGAKSFGIQGDLQTCGIFGPAQYNGGAFAAYLVKTGWLFIGSEGQYSALLPCEMHFVL